MNPPPDSTPSDSGRRPTPPRSRRRAAPGRRWFPLEQLLVTLALLAVFALAWAYGGPGSRLAGGRAARNAALDASTQRAATQRAGTQRASTAVAVAALTGPGYGRAEVDDRDFTDLRSITNSIGITLREVPRTLGLVGNAADPDGDAPPRVVRTEPFFLATTEVTRAQWKQICGPYSDPSIYSGDAAADDALPVNNIDFPEAIRFCRLLTAREGRNYRLPTEYEWEIACWGRRTRAIFGARAAMALAARVEQDDFANADEAGRRAIGDATMELSFAAARLDLQRLGFDPDADAAAFILAENHVRIVHRRALDALDDEPLPRDLQALRSRVYDTTLIEELPELRRATFARGVDATQARGAMDYAFMDRMLAGDAEAAKNPPSLHYAKYQAAWWRGRDPAASQGHPFGMQDMLGGLMEWTATPSMPYPMSMALARTSAAEVNAIPFAEAALPAARWATIDELSRFAFNRALRDKTFYIVRGGSFERAVESCSPWNRYGQLPMRTRVTAHRENLGFRVALEP